MNGKGIYISSRGNKFDGDWKQNKMDGVGIYSYADKRKYEGEWVSDMKHG